MTSLPPPTPPMPRATTWYQRRPWLVVLIAAVLTLAGVAAWEAVTGSSEEPPDPGTELMRVTWNGLTGAEQRDLCIEIQELGVDAVSRVYAREISGVTFSDAQFFFEFACEL